MDAAEAVHGSANRRDQRLSVVAAGTLKLSLARVPEGPTRDLDVAALQEGFGEGAASGFHDPPKRRP